jgi:hypothetical protein
LASLNLPAAIEVNGGSEVPPSVLEKSNDLKRQGGINILDTMISDLLPSRTSNNEILDEVECILSLFCSPIFLMVIDFY